MSDQAAAKISVRGVKKSFGPKRVLDGMTEAEFVAAAQADLEASEDADAPYYQRAAPFEQSFLGLERYWRKKGERDAEPAASA